MTRIIAGAARGIRLDVPDAGTRPTSDRVRESLFGSLESLDVIADARVLDLYAGSGALALESLSRGAQSADLVEKSRSAAGVIRRNASRLQKSVPDATIRVHEHAVRSFLARATGPFDLVFTDPPYDLDDASMNADIAALASLLSPDAVVIVERDRRATQPDFEAAGLDLFRERIYGDTGLWWAQPAQSEAQSR